MSCRPAKQPSNRMVYIDSRDATPHCATCEGIVATPPGFSGELNALIGDLQLALDCIAIFGGVPIPVKQDLVRKMASMRDALAANHILHDVMRAGGESEGD